MKRILYVASSPAMSSFATGFLAAAVSSNCITPYLIVFTAFSDKRNVEDITADFGLSIESISKVLIIRYSKSKLGAYVFQRKYIHLILRFARENEVKTMHFLTQDTLIAFHLSKFNNIEIYYTVHDLEPHEAKLSFLGRIKKYLLLTMKDKWIIWRVKHLVTSSDHQVRALKEMYPKKKIYQHHMPSLVTPKIITGRLRISELAGKDGYVLFFGRIEAYKGIDKLYDAFVNNIELASTKLVVAGTGTIYFKRDIKRESNIIFINRFIRDEEMNDLFSKAKIVVLPYTSATQSAVTSLSYYYKKPMIVSDIPGLRDTVIEGKTAIFINPFDGEDLIDKIVKLLFDNKLRESISENLTFYEDQFYGQKQLTEQIELLYNS